MTGNLPSGHLSPLGRRSRIMFVLIARHVLTHCSTPVRALTELTSSERRIFDAFVEARLLVTDVRDDQPVGQVAHEALFRQWPPLRQEVETRAEKLRRRTELWR